MGATSPTLGLDRLQQRQEDAEVSVNRMQNILESLVQGSVKSRTTSAQPGSPANGDRYVIPTGATGTNWSGQDGKVGIFYDGWTFLTPKEGWEFWVDDENFRIFHNGTSWEAIEVRSFKDSITAFAGGGQASATQLAHETNRVTTCATGGDSVKLPVLTTAKIGMVVAVINDGAASCNVYPGSGGQINALGTNNPFALAVGGVAVFRAISSTLWRSMLGA